MDHETLRIRFALSASACSAPRTIVVSCVGISRLPLGAEMTYFPPPARYVVSMKISVLGGPAGHVLLQMNDRTNVSLSLEVALAIMTHTP